MSVRAFATLTRHLGPWAGDALPRARRRIETVRAGERSVRVAFYDLEGRRPIGAYLLAPGLHYAGPDDPRLDRFCRVLAAAGILVAAPFLPDFLDLRISARTTDDLAAAWDVLEHQTQRLGLSRPALFSISFGSCPAIELAARTTHRDRVGALVLFGGFADFDAVVRFSITGRTEAQSEAAVAHDPLNAPAVFMNLLPYLDVPGDRRLLAQAWRTMVERTWGRMELKARGARDPIGHAIAEGLPSELRELFLVGCGLRSGGVVHLDAALAAAGDAFRFADPRPHLTRLAAPVFIVHGRDDDVIPWLEAGKLRRALAPEHPHRVYITGLYGHTGAARVNPWSLAQELRTMAAVAWTMVRAPTGR